MDGRLPRLKSMTRVDGSLRWNRRPRYCNQSKPSNWRMSTVVWSGERLGAPTTAPGHRSEDEDIINWISHNKYIEKNLPTLICFIQSDVVYYGAAIFYFRFIFFFSDRILNIWSLEGLLFQDTLRMDEYIFASQLSYVATVRPHCHGTDDDDDRNYREMNVCTSCLHLFCGFQSSSHNNERTLTDPQTEEIAKRGVPKKIWNSKTMALRKSSLRPLENKSDIDLVSLDLLLGPSINLIRDAY